MQLNGTLKKIQSIATGKFHHYAFQRIFRHQLARGWIATQVAKSKPRLDREPINTNERDDVERLSNDGFVNLPGLISAQQIIDIKDYLQNRLCYNRNRPQSTARFLPNEAPVGTHIAAYSDADTVNCPHVLELANNEHVLKIVGTYFKCQPTISNLSIWWSLTSDGKPEEAENFHRDIDDWKQLKLFIYLTDVAQGSGPHVFVRESHKIREALSTRRYSDEEIIDIFSQDRIVTFLGNQGTCFLENTFGLHKGTTAREGNRLLLQVMYSLNPLGVSEYNPISPKRSITAVDPYINRLYVL